MNPSDLKYHPGHGWARIEGDAATIGITDFAQAELREILYCDVPTPGMVLSRGDAYSEVESTKSISDVIAPLSGVVIESNRKLAEEPSLLNSDPYGEGWIARIRISNTAEVDELLEAARYEERV